jgi:two-component system sensor histidine kinase UhpB
VQQINRRILRRLRPIALKEIGLEAALSELVFLWRERNPQTQWSLEVSKSAEQIGEAESLTVYRMVQECLTNAARHADATRVEVRVDRLAADAAAIKDLEFPGRRGAIYVSVRDDGKGMPEQPSGGFGLLGIGERVRGMGGMLRISNPASGGTIVEAAIPVESGHG